MPLVDIIECRERAVEMLNAFVKPVNGNSIANAILSLPENEWIKDSEKRREKRRRVEKEELKEMMRTFGEDAWEVFRCVVQNGNMAPFRRVTSSETWWFSAGATENVTNLGEFAGVIMQTFNGGA
ncbi:hypothetical protein SUGI_0194700 [Cryptomeria japonica]|nr:hypothetical protein SUGI_0194700 [Cryptomeria japonica]